MTPEEKLEKIKEQNRIRAKRYYDNNQTKILKKRADNKKQCKDAIKCIETQCNCKEEKPKKKNSKTLLSQEESSTQLKELIENENSQKFYDNTLKTLVYILGCDDFNKCLKRAKTVIYKIENATQKKDPTKLYSVNSKKGIYQSILKLIDTLEIPISDNAHKLYENRFEIMNTASHDQTKERIQKEEVLDFNVYKQKVKNFFGESSKESIITSLYELSGFRDNLNVIIVPTLPKETDKNFIVIPSSKTKNLKFILNDYKTSGKYNQDIINIPKDLSKEIRKYMENNNIQYNDYLFGKSKLSGFIKKFNDKMDLPITINKLRQMKVSKVLNNNPSIEERIKLAKEMKHSTTTSEKYKRKIKEI